MVTAPAATGNPILAPVRMTGDVRGDIAALAKGLSDFYLRFAVDTNVIGELDALRIRMTKAETDIAAIKTILGIP